LFGPNFEKEAKDGKLWSSPVVKDPKIGAVATGVKARLCKDNIGGGSPPGKDPIAGYVPGFPGKILKVHLLSEQLGGPGTLKNLVTTCGTVNQRLYQWVEKIVIGWVQSGLVVDYEVVPVYSGSNPYPEFIMARARAIDPSSFNEASPRCQEINYWDTSSKWITGQLDIMQC
jgi:hypothetical protein